MDDFEELLRRGQEGDVDALERLNELTIIFARPIVVAKLQELHLTTEIDDVLSETWLSVYRKISDGDGPAARAFKSWVSTIAFRRCIDLHRRRREREVPTQPLTSAHLDQILPVGNSSQKLIDWDRLLHVWKQLAIPELQLISSVCQGFTNAEICESFQIKLSSLKRWKARVFAKVRQLWEQGEA